MAGDEGKLVQELIARSEKRTARGWTVLHIEGGPYERGFQHGYQLAAELERVLDVNMFWAKWSTGKDKQFFITEAVKNYLPYVDAECIEEIRGIADGSTKAGYERSFEEVFFWNSYIDLIYYWWPQQGKVNPGPVNPWDIGHRCSAFIATGSQTKDGRVVMAVGSPGGLGSQVRRPESHRKASCIPPSQSSKRAKGLPPTAGVGCSRSTSAST